MVGSSSLGRLWVFAHFTCTSMFKHLVVTHPSLYKRFLIPARMHIVFHALIDTIYIILKRYKSGVVSTGRTQIALVIGCEIVTVFK